MNINRPNRFAVVILTVLSLCLFTLFYSDDSALTKSVNAFLAPGISATKIGALDTTGGGDLNGNGLVNPGDRLDYTITIPNAGPDAATDVNLSDTIDADTTLVGGSVVASPIAVNDSFNTIGNVGISVPDGAGDLLANDLDANNPGNAAALVFTKINNANFSSGTAVATTNGSVTVNSNGSFTYTPNAGFEGSDTFTYTLDNGTGLTDTSTVTITVSGMIWFVNPAAASDGTGTLASPFKNLSTFSAANNGVGSNPADGDFIFLYSGTHTGGLTLRSSQKIIGQGATVSVLTFTGAATPSGTNQLPVTGGARPVIANNAGAGITLSTANTIRGLNAGGSTFAIDDTGSVSSLNISEVLINSSGGGFRADGGGVLSVTLDSITTAGGANGINIAGITTGFFTVTGAVTISNSTGDSISLTNNGSTFSVGGLTQINTTASGFIGIHLVGGGASGAINFGNVQINGRRGKAIRISGGGRNITTGAVDIDNTNSDVASAIEILAPSGGTISLGDTDINGNNTGSAAVEVQNSAAVVSFGSGSTIVGSTGTDFLVNQGNGNVTYNGSITNAGGGMITVTARTGGTIEFQGNLTSNTAGTPISALNNTGGTVIFSGTTKTLNSSTATAISLTANAGATFSFTNGGLDIDTTSGKGLSASGGGTINVTTGTNPNTINTTTGTAVEISGASAGSTMPLNIQLTSVSTNGGANGIFLQNTSATGAPGGFRILGNTSGVCGGIANPTGAATAPNAADCTGGTIQNTAGADGATSGNGIYLNNVQNVSLTRVKINDHANNGIFGTGVRGLTIANSLFNGNNGTSNSGTFDESAINLVDIGGAVSITNSFVSGGAFNNARLENITGTAPNLNLTMSGNTSGSMQGSTADVRSTAFLVNLTDGTLDADIQNNRLTVWWGNAIHVLVQGTASGTSNITGNFADNTNGALAGAGGIWVAGGTHTYNISGNTIRHTNGTAISADRVNFGSTMQGTIDGNTIGVSGDANSGAFTGIGIFASHHGPGTTIVKISNNVLRQINGSANGAITTQTGDALGFGGSGTMNATIVGNNIQESGTTVNNAQHGILITHGMQSGPPTDSDQGCYDIGGSTAALRNTIINFVSGTANNRIRVNQRFSTTSRFPGYTGAQLGVTSQTDLATYLLGRNTASTSTNANTSTGGFLNTSPAGSACPQPALPQPVQANVNELALSGSNLSEKLPDLDPERNLPNAGSESPSETQALTAPRPNSSTDAQIISNESVEANDTSYLTIVTGFVGELAGKIGSAVSPTVSAQNSAKERPAQNQSAPESGETINKALGTIPAGETVTVRFKVTVNANIPISDYSISNQATISGSNFASVLTDGDAAANGIQPTVTAVIQPPSISKAFGATNIAVGGVTSLTFTVTNGNVGQNYTQLAFSDTLPSGLIINTPNGLTNTCGGTITATENTNLISLSNGSLAAPVTAGTTTTCTIKVDVKATADGAQSNVSGAISSLQGGVGGTASATVNVFAAPSFAKQFGNAEIVLGDSTALTFTINNNSASLPLTNVSFTDNLPAGLVVAAAPNVTGSCGGTVTANAGASSISLSGATMGSTSVCVISVNVTGTTAGVKNNSVSLSTAELGTGATATANITVIEQTYSMTGTVTFGNTPVADAARFVPDVTITAAGTPAVSDATDAAGAYSLAGLSSGAYTVTPTKTGDVNGIESLDATRIQQYLVGLTTLTPNQLIAADTDNNGVVNSLDAARIQQYLVQIPAPNIIGQWKFVPASRQFASITSNLAGQDYEAILVGDVSGNWTAPSATPVENSQASGEYLLKDGRIGSRTESNGLMTEGQLHKSAPEAAVNGAAVNVTLPTNAAAAMGSSMTVPVTIGAVAAGSPIESFDFTVFYDPAILQPVAPFGSNAGTLSANCSVLSNSPLPGRVVVSGACATGITTAAGGVLYNLQFNVIGTSGQQTGLLFYNPSTGEQTFQFNSGTPSAAATNGLFSVLPGPTAASVTVSGKVTTASGRGIGNVQITLTDSQGSARTTQTTSFGYYKFDNVSAGETISITAKARRYKFNQSSIVRTTNESVADADFVSEQ